MNALIRRTAALLLAVTSTTCLLAPAAAARVLYVSPTTATEILPVVTRPYDPPATQWAAGHRGVDVLAVPGSPIYAAGTGTVSFVGPVATVPTLSIVHPSGIRTTYQPVDPIVITGQRVHAGQLIGTVSDQPAGHLGLHWGALTGRKKYMNPLHLLVDPNIRLKPAHALGNA